MLLGSCVVTQDYRRQPCFFPFSVNQGQHVLLFFQVTLGWREGGFQMAATPAA